MRKLHTVQYTSKVIQKDQHIDLGPEEVGQSLHVEPGLPRNGPQHDIAANVQLISQSAVKESNMTQIILKSVPTGRHLEQRAFSSAEEFCAICSEIIFIALSGSGGGVEMAEDDESVVSTPVVELDPETSIPRNLIIPRLSVGTPFDEDGTTGSD